VSVGLQAKTLERPDPLCQPWERNSSIETPPDGSLPPDATICYQLRALDEGMTALRRDTATLVTLHETGEERLPGGTVQIVPAWRWVLDRVSTPG